jgi:hypothetical protein
MQRKKIFEIRFLERLLVSGVFAKEKYNLYYKYKKSNVTHPCKASNLGSWVDQAFKYKLLLAVWLSYHGWSFIPSKCWTTFWPIVEQKKC